MNGALSSKYDTEILELDRQPGLTVCKANQTELHCGYESQNKRRVLHCVQRGHK
jgi:hypothetical protein